MQLVALHVRAHGLPLVGPLLVSPFHRPHGPLSLLLRCYSVSEALRCCSLEQVELALGCLLPLTSCLLLVLQPQTAPPTVAVRDELSHLLVQRSIARTQIPLAVLVLVLAVLPSRPLLAPLLAAAAAGTASAATGRSSASLAVAVASFG